MSATTLLGALATVGAVPGPAGNSVQQSLRSRTTAASAPRMPVILYFYDGYAGLSRILSGLIERNARAIRERKAAPWPPEGHYSVEPVWKDAVVATEDGDWNYASAIAWAAGGLEARGERVIIEFTPTGVPFIANEDGSPRAAVSGVHLSEGDTYLARTKQAAGKDPMWIDLMLLGLDDNGATPICEVGNAIARHNAYLMRTGRCGRIPMLADSNIRYEFEGLPEQWLDAPSILRRGWDDCEGLAAYRAGEIIATEGKNAQVWTRRIDSLHDSEDRNEGLRHAPSPEAGASGGRTFHAVTRVILPDGTAHFDDPSSYRGMPTPDWYIAWAKKRRAKGLPL